MALRVSQLGFGVIMMSRNSQNPRTFTVQSEALSSALVTACAQAVMIEEWEFEDGRRAGPRAPPLPPSEDELSAAGEAACLQPLRTHLSCLLVT